MRRNHIDVQRTMGRCLLLSPGTQLPRPHQNKCAIGGRSSDQRGPGAPPIFFVGAMRQPRPRPSRQNKAPLNSGASLSREICSVSRLLLFQLLSCLRGRPRLRRPFLGGRPSRFAAPTWLAVVRPFVGASTDHPAFRRRSMASTKSVTFIAFSRWIASGKKAPR